MTEEQLDVAARAFFQATQKCSTDERALRRRVLQTLSAQRSRRRSFHFWLLPAATLVLGGGALAASGLPSIHPLARVFALTTDTPASSTPRRGVSSSAANTAPSIHGDIAPLGVPPISTTPGIYNLRERNIRNNAGIRPTPSLPNELKVAVPSREVMLFREAQHLHFSGSNVALAAEAWRQYLEEFPSAALSPEARFNRALCLIRLGRSQQATALLKTFANGGTKGYRAEESRALLRALGQSGSPR